MTGVQTCAFRSIPSGKNHTEILSLQPDAIHFVNEAYKHCKAIAADGDAVSFLQKTFIKESLKKDGTEEAGILINKKPTDFITAIAQHRFWEREAERKVPA